MTEKFLPLSAMEKIMKRVGATRVSDKSKVALKRVLEDIADSISRMAIDFARHAGRKTVKAEDVKLAIKQFENKF